MLPLWRFLLSDHNLWFIDLLLLPPVCTQIFILNLFFHTNIFIYSKQRNNIKFSYIEYNLYILNSNVYLLILRCIFFVSVYYMFSGSVKQKFWSRDLFDSKSILVDTLIRLFFDIFSNFLKHKEKLFFLTEIFYKSRENNKNLIKLSWLLIYLSVFPVRGPKRW